MQHYGGKAHLLMKLTTLRGKNIFIKKIFIILYSLLYIIAFLICLPSETMHMDESECTIQSVLLPMMDTLNIIKYIYFSE